MASRPSQEESRTQKSRAIWAARNYKALLEKRDVLVECEQKNHPPISRSGEASLWNVVNRIAYTAPEIKKEDIGLTVVVTHAAGYHKEVSPVNS